MIKLFYPLLVLMIPLVMQAQTELYCGFSDDQKVVLGISDITASVRGVNRSALDYATDQIKNELVSTECYKLESDLYAPYVIQAKVNRFSQKEIKASRLFNILDTDVDLVDYAFGMQFEVIDKTSGKVFFIDSYSDKKKGAKISHDVGVFEGETMFQLLNNILADFIDDFGSYIDEMDRPDNKDNYDFSTCPLDEMESKPSVIVLMKENIRYSGVSPNTTRTTIENQLLDLGMNVMNSTVVDDIREREKYNINVLNPSEAARIGKESKSDYVIFGESSLDRITAERGMYAYKGILAGQMVNSHTGSLVGSEQVSEIGQDRSEKTAAIVALENSGTSVTRSLVAKLCDKLKDQNKTVYNLSILNSTMDQGTEIKAELDNNGDIDVISHKFEGAITRLELKSNLGGLQIANILSSLRYISIEVTSMVDNTLKAKVKL